MDSNGDSLGDARVDLQPSGSFLRSLTLMETVTSDERLHLEDVQRCP